MKNLLEDFTYFFYFKFIFAKGFINGLFCAHIFDRNNRERDRYSSEDRYYHTNCTKCGSSIKFRTYLEEDE